MPGGGLREEVHEERGVDPALADPLGSEALRLPGVRQVLREEGPPEEALQDSPAEGGNRLPTLRLPPLPLPLRLLGGRRRLSGNTDSRRRTMRVHMYRDGSTVNKVTY